MKIIKGKLEAFFEQGSEGIYWSLVDLSDKKYDLIHIIEEGDYLEVYNKKGEIYWEGEIHKDCETNLEEIEPPRGAKWEQQVVKVKRPWGSEYRAVKDYSILIHWLQKDVDPSFWAQMFFDKMDAELKKK